MAVSNVIYNVALNVHYTWSPPQTVLARLGISQCALKRTKTKLRVAGGKR